MLSVKRKAALAESGEAGQWPVKVCHFTNGSLR